MFSKFHRRYVIANVVYMWGCGKNYIAIGVSWIFEEPIVENEIEPRPFFIVL